jgi:hypothetical protein
LDFVGALECPRLQFSTDAVEFAMRSCTNKWLLSAFR